MNLTENNIIGLCLLPIAIGLIILIFKIIQSIDEQKQ